MKRITGQGKLPTQQPSLTPTTGATYLWTVTSLGGSASIQGSATGSSVVVSASGLGFVNLCVTVTFGIRTAKCCLDVRIVPDTGPSCTVPTANIIRYDCSPCMPSQHPDWRYESEYTNYPNPNPNLTYNWSVTGGNVQFVTGNGGPDIILKPVSGGMFKLTLTITNTACGASSSKTITVDPQIDCPIIPSGGECDGDDHHLTISPNPTNNDLSLTYKLEQTSQIRILLQDGSGTSKTIELLKNTKVLPGIHQMKIDKSKLTKKGVYLISLIVNDEIKQQKRVLIE